MKPVWRDAGWNTLTAGIRTCTSRLRDCDVDWGLGSAPVRGHWSADVAPPLVVHAQSCPCRWRDWRRIVNALLHARIEASEIEFKKGGQRLVLSVCWQVIVPLKCCRNVVACVLLIFYNQRWSSGLCVELSVHISPVPPPRHAASFDNTLEDPLYQDFLRHKRHLSIHQHISIPRGLAHAPCSPVVGSRSDFVGMKRIRYCVEGLVVVIVTY